MNRVKTFSLKDFLSDKKNRRLCLFWFLAYFPLMSLDILLRYMETGTSYGIAYHILAAIFTLLWVSAITFFCVIVLGRKAGRILYLILTVLLTLWFLANYIYFDVTGQYLFLDSIGMVGEASDYLGIVMSHMSAPVVTAFLACIACFVGIWLLWPRFEKQQKKKKLITMIIPISGIVIMHIFMFAWRMFDNAIGVWEPWGHIPYIYNDFKDSPKCMNVAGFYQYTFKSLCDSVLPTNEYSKKDKEYTEGYYASKPEPAPNDMTGIFAGKNVIVVMLESIDDWMISEKYTPTMKYMMDNGINFADNYTPTRGTGFTFSTEFCFNTGFYCPTARSSAAVFTEKPFVTSIANLFRRSGYCARSFHYNTGDFYNRELMHTQFGYESYTSFMNYMTYKQSILDSEVIANDEVFNLLTNTGDPERPLFFDFVITYSAHLPYEEDDLKSKLINKKYPGMFDETIDPEIAYARLFAHDTDEFFRILLQKLENAGILDDTVIVGFTDHYSYGVNNSDELERVSLEAGSPILEKTPLFIYNPGAPKLQVTKPSSTCDIFPTLVNLMGIKNTKYVIGNDVFNPENTGFVFYANNSWYDGSIFYNTEEPPDTAQLTPEQQEYISQTNEYAKNLNRINDYVIESGFYETDHSLPPEEPPAEEDVPEAEDELTTPDGQNQ